MKSMQWLVVCGVLLGWAVPTPSYAQRGMGDTSGVARQAVKPAVVSIKGTVREVVTEPCAQTTGRSYQGTHVVVVTEDDAVVNVHLGPAVQVASMAEQLTADKQIEVAGFRTEKMPENHYVAQVITIGAETLRLRDENLRPLWAGSGRGGSGSPAAGGPGNFGRGPGWGRGGMGGRGAGYGRGMGAGYGRGMGAGWRHGNGSGWGPAYIDENNDGVCDWLELPRTDQ